MTVDDGLGPEVSSAKTYLKVSAWGFGAIQKRTV